MVNKLKRIATRKKLTILMISNLMLGAINTVLLFIWLDGMLKYDWFDRSNFVSSAISNLLGYIAPIILFVAILNLNKESSEKILVTSMIAGISVSLINSFIIPAASGSAFSAIDTESIGSLVLLALPVFIIVDVFKKHIFANVSCIITAVMIGVHLIAAFSNVAILIRYRDVYNMSVSGSLYMSVLGSLRAILHWIIMLFYLIRFVKTKPQASFEKPKAKSDAICVEERLTELKAQYGNGEITEEEYGAIKEIILWNFMSDN